jgi:hypothetical protein
MIRAWYTGAIPNNTFDGFIIKQEPEFIDNNKNNTFDKKFFENSIQKLKKSGVFIIEDISNGFLLDFNDWVIKNEKNFKSIEILTIPTQGSVQDNNRVIIIKK